MLFHVRMDVAIPFDIQPDRVAELKRVERERARELQKQGKWRHLWRIVGQYSNFSLFDVADTQELHDILSTLPLFAFMTIEVLAVCRHPSSIHADDR